MNLSALPYEKQLKLIDQAQDVLDRDGWCTGFFHAVKMYRPEDQEIFVIDITDVDDRLIQGWTFVTSAEDVEHCALGAIEQAAFEQGELEELGQDDDEQIENVATLLGFGGGEAQDIYHVNDGAGGSGEAALAVARDLVLHRAQQRGEL